MVRGAVVSRAVLFNDGSSNVETTKIQNQFINVVADWLKEHLHVRLGEGRDGGKKTSGLYLVVV